MVVPFVPESDHLVRRHVPGMDPTPRSDDDDLSSIISTSSRPGLSDSSPSPSERHVDLDPMHDTLKYRLPDDEKSRGGSGAASTPGMPPTPPPKHHDATRDGYFPPAMPAAARQGDSEGSGEESGSYFNPYGLSRVGSMYTLSRASFTNQISQLTSIRLPQASSLSDSIAAIPSSAAAAATLDEAADQIKRWMSKASDVLSGLDAEDDVEWAAAGGREGLGEVDAAINRFESLVEVFVIAIDQLQRRTDISSLGPEKLRALVTQMDEIMVDWERIKEKLGEVKIQVEMAMEWEELWNTVLGEIGLELTALGRLVFEMEERRHRTAMLEAMSDPSNSIDIGELETIVEEAPVRQGRPISRNRYSVEPATSPCSSPAVQKAQDDSNLLALFARMQPLRASLDFLPMRLSAFQQRAIDLFPTGCEDLDKRREQLEEQWKKLESDAEILRRELGEDRWVLVFRNAGRQAFKMCESVARSLAKLREALDEGVQHTNTPSAVKKIENYEAKKTHYGPAIERVLAIIDRGVKDRLTVNGEILRLQADMRRRWSDLESEMKAMDFVLEGLNINRGQALRDSISTILTDRSVTSSTWDTPGSSPASSIVLMSRKDSDQGTSTPYGQKSRQSSFASSTKTQTTLNRRLSGIPALSSSVTRKSAIRSSVGDADAVRSPSPATSRYLAPTTPTPSRVTRATSDTAPKPARPRWNSSTNMKDTVVGHHYKPTTTPSPQRKTSTQSLYSRSSAIPVPSPLSRSTSRPPSALATSRIPSTTPTATRTVPTPALKTPTVPRLRAPASTSRLNPTRPPSSISAPIVPTLSTATASRRASYMPSSSRPAADDASPSAQAAAAARPPRPASVMATGRRSSMLPLPRPGARASVGGTGRDSRAGGRTTSMDKRPPWR